ncbi:MAG: hypothetical protein RI973_553 [Bacteroidota bacterium]
MLLLPLVMHGQFTLSKQDASGCGKKDGSITATVSISGNIQFSLDGGAFQSSGTFSNLGAGIYTVTAKEGLTGCQTSETVEINDGSDLMVTVSGGGSFELCGGGSAPEIVLSASATGGTQPYQFSWPNGTRTVSAAGNYTCTVTDSTGCQDAGSATVVVVPIQCSRDPNDITGPTGFSTDRWVAKKDVMPYLIRFENDPQFATASAQKVTVEYPLDDQLNLFSVRLGSFGFANMTFNVPANSTFYSQRLDVQDSLGIFVDVTAGIDVDAGKAFWIFESIDPATGLPPTGTNVGMLPVNDTITRRGEGFVNFTAKPKNSAVTGDSITAQAVIVFDVNEPILTNEYLNLVDAVAPTSVLDSLPASQDSIKIQLSWSGQDDPGGTGLREYAVFVSENSSPFNLWQGGLTDTAAVFTGASGGEYSFFTLATDNVGNTEAAKSQGDFTVKIARDPLLQVTSFSKPIYCHGDSLRLLWDASQVRAVDVLVSSGTGQPFSMVGNDLPVQNNGFAWLVPGTFPACNPCFMLVRDTTTGSPLTDTAAFAVSPPPVASAGNDAAICIGEYLQLQASGGTSYSWSPPAGLSNSAVAAPFASPASSTVYTVQVTDALGCKDTDELLVTVHLKDTTFFNIMVCDTGTAGLAIDTLVNYLGCDSLIITTTTFAEPNLVISDNNLPGGVYRSVGPLVSNNTTIMAGRDAKFTSDTNITLQPLFTVQVGALFEARVEVCPPSFNGPFGSKIFKQKKKKK